MSGLAVLAAVHVEPAEFLAEGLLVGLYRRAPGPVLVLDGDGVPEGASPRPHGGTTSSSQSPRSASTAATRSRSAGACSALYDHLLVETDEPAQPRVHLERRLLDGALARAFPDAEEQSIAGRPDRLGLGAGAPP